MFRRRLHRCRHPQELMQAIGRADLVGADEPLDSTISRLRPDRPTDISRTGR